MEVRCIGIEIDINNSIRNTIKLNEQIKVLHGSASSIKISQSFSQSIVTSMEMVKSKSKEVQSSFKEIAKGSGVKESVGDQSKYFHKFIEDLNGRKIRIKAILDLSKNDIQKMMSNINITNSISTSVNVVIATDTLQETMKEIKESFKESTDSISVSLNSTKEIINDIKISFEAMFTSNNGVDVVDNQRKYFVKIRQEIQEAQEAITKYNNEKIKTKEEKKSSRSAQVQIDVAIARTSLENDMKLQSHSLKEFISQKYYLTLALKDMAKDKIESIISRPRKAVVSVIANTSLAIKKISAIKDKMKLLSSPISFIAKTFIKPALADKNDPSSADAAKQIERVKASIERVKSSIEGMKATIGKVFMPIISGVLRPIADWLEKNQPKIDKFIQGISGKIKVVMSVVEPIIGRFFVKLSKVIEGLLPTFTSVFKAIPNIIQGMQPVLERVFSFIVATIRNLPPIFDVITSVIKFLGEAWNSMWPTISSILETAWGIVEPIFSIFRSLAQTIVDIFATAWPGISTAVQGVWEFIKPILDLIGDALGGIARVASWIADAVGGLFGGDGDSSKGNKGAGSSGKAHAFGLARVPYDNYPALLHEGERVLTKQEVNSSSGFRGVSIAKLADTIVVREEADIDKISNALVNKLQNAAFNMA